MRRPLSLFGIVLLALAAVSLPAYAQNASASGPGMGRGLAHLQRCLSNLGLSSDQQTAIQAIVSAAKPTLQADAQPLKADGQKLRADISAGADKCVIGQDVISAHADRAKLTSDIQAIRDEILAKLSTDQQNQLKGCWQAFPHRFGRRLGSGS